MRKPRLQSGKCPGNAFPFWENQKNFEGLPLFQSEQGAAKRQEKARRPAHCGAPRFEACAGRIRLFCVIAVPVLHVVLIELRQTGGRVELVGAAA